MIFQDLAHVGIDVFEQEVIVVVAGAPSAGILGQAATVLTPRLAPDLVHEGSRGPALDPAVAGTGLQPLLRHRVIQDQGKHGQEGVGDGIRSCGEDQ